MLRRKLWKSKGEEGPKHGLHKPLQNQCKRYVLEERGVVRDEYGLKVEKRRYKGPIRKMNTSIEMAEQDSAGFCDFLKCIGPRIEGSGPKVMVIGINDKRWALQRKMMEGQILWRLAGLGRKILEEC